MNFEKYTDRSRGFVQSAQSLAQREGHQQFAPEHLLKVLLDDPEGLAAGLIDRAGGNSRAALAATEAALAKRPKISGGGAGQVYLDPALGRVFDAAEKAGEKAGDSFVSAERLLLALALERQSEAGKILANAGVTPQTLNAAIEALRKEFAQDLKHEKVEHINVDPNIAIVAVVGENMRGTPGVAGRTFQAMGRENVNIIAIAQGSSESNISFVIEESAVKKALLAAHREFGLHLPTNGN